jgi:hypothetical protein
MATFTSFSVDLNTGIITLNFDSVINSIDTSQLIACSDNTGANAVSLFGSTVVNGIGTSSLTIQLSNSSFNKIKSNSVLWTSTTYAWLAISSTSTSPVTAATTLQAYIVIADTTSPQLTYWDYQGGANAPWNLSLTFSEPVNTSTISLPAITLQSGAAAPTTESLTLSAGGTVIPSTGLVTTVLIKLTAGNISILNGFLQLGQLANKTYLSCTTSLIQDRANNSVVAIPTSNALQVRNLTLNGVAVGYNLANTSDLRIAGGTSGYALSTDGNANLIWANIGGGGGSIISNGTSNVSIATSGGNITAAVGGASVMRLASDKYAFGAFAGTGTQGVGAISLGYQAGYSVQGTGAIAIGYLSAAYGTQGANAVAIGPYAGSNGQGAGSISIGSNAGAANASANSIYIGANAGINGGSLANVIVLNSTGANLNPAAANGLYISTVRNDTGNVTNALYFNTTTKELTYGAAGGGGGSSISNGNSNVTVSANSNVTFGITGTANILVVNANGISVANVTSNLLPNANVTYNLGSSTQRWNDLWLSNSTIHIGNGTITADDANSKVIISNAVTTQAITLTGNGTTISGNVNFATAATVIANAFTSNNYILGNGNTTVSTTRWLTAATLDGSANQVIYQAVNTSSSIDIKVIVTDSGDGNNRQSSMITTVTNGANTSYSEYATTSLNSKIANFAVDQSGGNVRLLASPSTANTVNYQMVITTFN